MLNTLKAVWILFWAALLTLVLFLPIVIAALAGRNGNAAFHGTQVYAWCMLRLTGIRLEVSGREHIDPAQRYVILSNHASYFDPPALVLALGLQYRWVIKKELRKVPLFGLALETSRNLFIDRSKGSDALESIKRGVAQLPEGTSILMFPEGTRSWDGKLLPFKKGGFVIARDGELPVLPVTIRGSHDRLPKGTAVFSPGLIEIIVHPPVAIAGREVREVQEEVKGTIEGAL
jgi:1-acyl-sn-glycerol-3-phosphate acyltransferase